MAELLVEGERWPVYVHVIEHPEARVLIDTGMTELHPAVADMDPNLFPLSDQAFDLAGIDVVVNTHLHFDHCGGNNLFAGRPIYVQRQELEDARADDYTIRLAQDIHQLIDGCHAGCRMRHDRRAGPRLCPRGCLEHPSFASGHGCRAGADLADHARPDAVRAGDADRQLLDHLRRQIVHVAACQRRRVAGTDVPTRAAHDVHAGPLRQHPQPHQVPADAVGRDLDDAPATGCAERLHLAAAPARSSSSRLSRDAQGDRRTRPAVVRLTRSMVSDGSSSGRQ